MARYEQVTITGDSLMRGLAVALHQLTRRSLVDGGRTTWWDDPEGVDCSCENAYMNGGCGFHIVVSTEMVHLFDDGSLFCGYEGHAKVERKYLFP